MSARMALFMAMGFGIGIFIPTYLTVVAWLGGVDPMPAWCVDAISIGGYTGLIGGVVACKLGERAETLKRKKQAASLKNL